MSAQQDGTIKVLTVARADAQRVRGHGDARRSPSCRSMPNRNDDGTLNPGVTGRLVTGLLVTGTAGQPRRSTSCRRDPRIGGGDSGADLDLDTNSGILSRLTRYGGRRGPRPTSSAVCRGPRRTTPATAWRIDPATDRCSSPTAATRTRARPRTTSPCLPEYALSAAILSVDLDAIGERDLRPAHPRRRGPARHRRRQRPVRRQQRQEPGAARARRAGAGLRRRASATPTTSCATRVGRPVHDRQRRQRRLGRRAAATTDQRAPAPTPRSRPATPTPTRSHPHPGPGASTAATPTRPGPTRPTRSTPANPQSPGRRRQPGRM